MNKCSRPHPRQDVRTTSSSPHFTQLSSQLRASLELVRGALCTAAQAGPPRGNGIDSVFLQYFIICNSRRLVQAQAALLAGDEPVEALEPVRLAHLLRGGHCADLPRARRLLQLPMRIIADRQHFEAAQPSSSPTSGAWRRRHGPRLHHARPCPVQRFAAAVVTLAVTWLFQWAALTPGRRGWCARGPPKAQEPVPCMRPAQAPHLRLRSVP